MYAFVIIASVFSGLVVGIGAHALTGVPVFAGAIGGACAGLMKYALDTWAYQKSLEIGSVLEAMTKIEKAIIEDYSSMEQVEALKKQLAEVDLECKFCKQANEPNLIAKCEASGCTCMTCNADCQCRTCKDRNNYEWIGVKEDEE